MHKHAVADAARNPYELVPLLGEGCDHGIGEGQRAPDSFDLQRRITMDPRRGPQCTDVRRLESRSLREDNAVGLAVKPRFPP